jgi:tryptophan aminotransferase
LIYYRFKLNLSSTTDTGGIITNNDGSTGDSETAIRTTAFNKGVLALPGNVFLPNGNKTAYVRASFSLNPEEEVYEALKRLRETVVEARGE